MGYCFIRIPPSNVFRTLFIIYTLNNPDQTPCPFLRSHCQFCNFLNGPQVTPGNLVKGLSRWKNGVVCTYLFYYLELKNKIIVVDIPFLNYKVFLNLSGLLTLYPTNACLKDTYFSVDRRKQILKITLKFQISNKLNFHIIF